MLFVDRGRRADRYPWFEWKLRLFVIGAALGVGGMVMENDWITLVAIVVLFAGFLLRFVPGGTGEDEMDEDEMDEELDGDGFDEDGFDEDGFDEDGLDRDILEG